MKNSHGRVSRRGCMAMAVPAWLLYSRAALAFADPGSSTLSAGNGNALRYTRGSKEPCPIPPGEQRLQTVVAQPFLQVSTHGLGNFKDTGSVYWIYPDGSGYTTVIPASAGYLPDDLVFDSHGGFYFTDFRGSTNEPRGGVYYVAPDLKTVTAVLTNMAIANGVCLSPDGKVLWATELSAGRLHRVEMTGPTAIAPFGTEVPYAFTGFGPDSMRADRDGNIYVAMYSQGRILVFNPVGIPIGQILIPKRDTGHNLLTTSMGFFPGSDRMLIVTSDGERGEGAWIFAARGFAPGVQLYSHA